MKSFKTGWMILLAGCLLLGACSAPAAVTPALETAPPVADMPTGLPAASPAAPTLEPATQPAPTQGPAPTVELSSPSAALTEQVAAGPDAAVPELPIAGIEMHQIAPSGGLQQALEAGAYWIRRNSLQWPAVEPQPGIRNWEAVAGLEAELATASERGLQTILIVHRTPDWAQTTPGALCGAIRGDQLGAFADFLSAAVARYSAPPYNVKYWELGNEPDVDPSLIPPEMPFGCWGDLHDPYYGGGYYAEMLKRAYPAMKAVDSEAQVVIGGLLMDCDPVDPPLNQAGQAMYCDPSLFLEGILKNGGGAFFDGVSFHGYDYYPEIPGLYVNVNWRSASNSTGPVLIAKSRYIRSVLEQYGVPDKFVMNTESAIVCLASEARCRTEGLEQTKANYVAQANAAALAEGLRANIWYSITGWRFSDMLNSQLQPYPVLRAFQASAERLRGATFTRALDEYPGLMGYEFERDGKPFWIIWALDEQPHTIRLPTAPAAVFDLYGSPLPAGAEVQVTIAPVYIHW